MKCITIDPPYNTGNEKWAYNDNVNSPMMQSWLGQTVDREDLTRHDKWCCMMLPRLKLLRELLTEDGAIFVLIDDNEVHHLRCLMDEVFGEENFVGELSSKLKFLSLIRPNILYRNVWCHLEHCSDGTLVPSIIAPIEISTLLAQRRYI